MPRPLAAIKLTLAKAYRTLVPRPKPANWPLYQRAVAQKIGLEIGGPSRFWSSGHYLPVYPICQYVDGCNFAVETVWEGHIRAGLYRCEGAHGQGRQFIVDGSNLAILPDQTYDFVLSCHSLEHIANPIRALKEWLRVLKPHGYLLLTVPHRDGYLPYLREVTPLAHLIDDYTANTTEHDLTHMDEMVEAHARVMPQDRAQERARLERNFEHRMLHHHCFDPRLVVDLIDHLGLQIRAVNLLAPYHINCLAEKLPEGEQPDNAVFLNTTAEFLHNAPYAVDGPCRRP